jgi:hypothetical protein
VERAVGNGGDDRFGEPGLSSWSQRDLTPALDQDSPERIAPGANRIGGEAQRPSGFMDGDAIGSDHDLGWNYGFVGRRGQPSSSV